MLATIVPGLACNDDGPLSDDEMTLLRAFTLPAQLPEDRSNRYADDLLAAKLGKKLYFEAGFSGLLGAYNVAKGVNGALGAVGQAGLVSCQSCHDPATGGADHRSQPNATSLGASYTGRNAPTVINAAYSPVWQFWDGRADSLWSQALSPPEGAAECNGTRLDVAHVIFTKYHADYDEVFTDFPLPAEVAGLPPSGKPGEQAFDSLSDTNKEIVNRIYANFGKAIAAYERLLISPNFEPSPFDSFLTGDQQRMSPAAIRGAQLFVGRAGCTECHRGPMFTDFTFHNIGAPQTGEYANSIDDGRADGIVLLMDASNLFTRGDPTFSDDSSDTAHLQLLAPLDDPTKRSPYKGQFKTPTLRNVSKTAPYMHDGAYQTLWDVVNHYNFGGATGQYEGVKDPALAPLMLTNAELGDLVEFLRALDDGPAKAIDGFDEDLLAAP